MNEKDRKKDSLADTFVKNMPKMYKTLILYAFL